jgi:hypothetical protein
MATPVDPREKTTMNITNKHSQHNLEKQQERINGDQDYSFCFLGNYYKAPFQASYQSPQVYTKDNHHLPHLLSSFPFKKKKKKQYLFNTPEVRSFDKEWFHLPSVF